VIPDHEAMARDFPRDEWAEEEDNFDIIAIQDDVVEKRPVSLSCQRTSFPI